MGAVSCARLHGSSVVHELPDAQMTQDVDGEARTETRAERETERGRETHRKIERQRGRERESETDRARETERTRHREINKMLIKWSRRTKA